MPAFHCPPLPSSFRHALRATALGLGGCLLAATSFAQQPVNIRPVAHQEQPPPAVHQLPPQGQLAPPQPHAGLALEQLEQMALHNNPSLGRAHAQVQIAKGTWVQVGLPPNPSVGYSGQQLGSNGLAEQHGVYVTQEIVRGGKLNLNRQAAAHEVARAEQELVAQQYRVLTDVRTAYYRVLIAQRQIDLTTDIARMYSQALDTTNKLLKAQEISRLDLLDAQLDLENARVALQNAQYSHSSAWRSLTAVLGQPDFQPQPLAGDVTVAAKKLNYQEMLQRMLTASPEIAAAASEIERARWAYQRALVEHKGNVNLQALYNWQDNGIGGRPDGALIVDMPIPIWNKNQGGIVKAQGEVTVAEHKMALLELDIQQRLAPVFERYESSANQVERMQGTILKLAQENVDLSRKAYQAGEQTYLEMLDAQRKYSNAHSMYLDALRDLRLAEAEMEGFLLQNSLQAK
ncbi:TolC family protein [Anatilimnocola floriformis]|uniref:TolC family protein n=1 Tax=Anatilimnocola floriformis TaxID=2948575 RepID=UPI0020C1E1EE|nr:TolC family protein [Anatilimnocola floriformis]